MPTAILDMAFDSKNTLWITSYGHYEYLDYIKMVKEVSTVPVFGNGDIKDVESAIVSYHHYWIDEHSPVESYDRETGKLTMAYKSRFLITNLYEEEHCPANLYYYLENIAEVFENPGEWYLERKSGMLYYMPENDSQTPENIGVYAPVVDRIVDICGSSELPVSDIRFRGLDFICSKGDYASRVHTEKTMASDDVFGSDGQSVAGAYGAVNFKYATNCSVSDCSLKNLGVQAVSVEEGCSDIRVEGCTVYDVGAGGVRIFGGAYGCEKHDETHHIIVRDCNISYCGRRYAAGCGILANHVYSCEFSGNEIGYLDYSGISVGWVWGYNNSITCANRISDNHIHHIGMGNLSDMGGIYLLGKQRGTVVSGNRIHDVICKHYGGWGIYTDEGSSFITVENNVVYNTSSNCYHQHYGSDNVIRNNVFAFGGDTVIRCSVPEMHCCLAVEGNILVTDGKPIFATYTAENGINPGVCSHHNIIWDVSGEEPVLFKVGDCDITLSEAMEKGFETGSVNVNPELDENFLPKAGSEVCKLCGLPSC